MAAYQCCFLDGNGQVVRTEVLRPGDEVRVHRDAMALVTRAGRFSGYELWAEGRKVEMYRPLKRSKSAVI